MTDQLYIFLDIDGVLNTENCGYSRNEETGLPVFDRDTVRNLNSLTKQTKAVLVISSNWRRCTEEAFQLLINHFRLEGVNAAIVGRTVARLSQNNRTSEIEDYLYYHPEVKNYLILDDRTDITRGLEKHWVQTDELFGFLKEHLEKALKLCL